MSLSLGIPWLLYVDCLDERSVSERVECLLQLVFGAPAAEEAEVCQ